MSNGCYNCILRHPGCHADCDTYHAWLQDLKKGKAQEQAVKRSESEYYNYSRTSMGRIRKRMRWDRK